MSRSFAAFVGLLGVVGGVLAGLPYLSHTRSCVELGTPQLSCTLTAAVAPFISAIAIGFVLAMAIGSGLAALSRRVAAPRPPNRSKRRAAVEVDNPSLQIAAWGLPPHARQRVSST